MKTLKQIFQALLGIAAALMASLIVIARWSWLKFKTWWKNRRKWFKLILISIITLVVIGIIYQKTTKLIARMSPYWKESFTNNNDLHTYHDGTVRIYDKGNKKYLTPRYDWILFINHHDDHDDTLVVFCDDNKRGFLNKYTGEVVIEPQYDAAWVFSDGLAAVKKDDKIGFINKNNEVVIPFIFGYHKRNYDYGYIDYVFHGGYSNMIDDSGNQGLIDKKGEYVIKPLYTDICKNWCTNGYLVILDDDKYGYYDSNLQMIYAPEYDDIIIHDDGFILTKDGRMWKEDSQGNVVIPFMYEYIQNMSYIVDYKDESLVYELSDEFVIYVVDDYMGIYNIKTNEPVTAAIFSDVDMIKKDLFSVELDYDGCYFINGKGELINDTIKNVQ